MSGSSPIDQLTAFLKAFSKNESGATAIEYAIIASGICGAIVSAVFSLGDPVNGMYGGVVNAVTGG